MLAKKGRLCVFRGENDPSYTLAPSFERLWSRSQRNPVHLEVSLRCRIQSEVHNFLQGQQAPEDNIELLALMQHHGAPTRLLDWTFSPYAAAFFAFEHEPAKQHHVAIWAVDLYDFIPVVSSVATEIFESKFHELVSMEGALPMIDFHYPCDKIKYLQQNVEQRTVRS